MDSIRIRMLINVRPDFPMGLVAGAKSGTILRAGKEYDAVSNRNGAISGVCENGETL